MTRREREVTDINEILKIMDACKIVHVGLCNWDQPQLTSQMCEELYQNMEKAKIRSEHIFLFSATRFEPMLAEHAKTDDRFELIDMNEL